VGAPSSDAKGAPAPAGTPAPDTKGAPAPAAGTPAADAIDATAASAAFGPADPTDDDATLTVLNRPVVVFRAPFLGVAPKDRVDAARERLRTLFSRGGEGKVSLVIGEIGVAVLVDSQLAFVVSEADARPVPGATMRSIAEDAAKVLAQIERETREARDSKFLTGAGIHAAIATAVWLALLWLARLLWRTSARWMMRHAERQAGRVKVGGGELIPRARAIAIVRAAMTLLGLATMLLLTWEWLGYVLGLFPYTRPWAEGLTGFLVRTSVGLLEAIAHAAPSLFVAVLIFVIAWAVNRVQKRLFDRVEAGGIAFGSIDRDTAPATRRLATAAIWLFAAVMAYPYIPGSDTDAFKGLSVLLGLMVSVGASGIVGQAAAGLILMYTRTFRTGEYVRIGDRDGTLTRMGLFTSTLRTGLGEELTLPNSQILASVTTNFTRVIEGPGFMVAAKVSIGYDAPWRQVHAMLIEAAKRTNGILEAPPPRVFQTSLDDFYVQYRLVCQASPREPLERAMLVSALNAAIQDVFNENGVQIMSPHYLGDPAEAKVVPRSRWFAPPAKKE
jgi:small-conductance mechanosensitive channel